MIATSGPTGKLRVLPGTYTESLNVTSATSLVVYGDNATVAGSAKLDVKAGNVEVRGLTVQSTVAEGVICAAAAGLTPPQLTLKGVRNIGSLAVINCVAHVERYVQLNGNVRLGDDGTLVADRAIFDNSAATSFLADFLATASRVSVSVTNSVLINQWLQFNTTDLATTSKVSFAYSTLVVTVTGSGVGPVNCATAANYAQVGMFEDNIIIAPTGLDAVAGTKCTITNNVLFPQSTARPGNTIADPQFVDQPAKNYHLKMTSPAREAAMPSTGLTTDHDYDGVMRPQGANPDIGAFEYKP